MIMMIMMIMMMIMADRFTDNIIESRTNFGNSKDNADVELVV